MLGRSLLLFPTVPVLTVACTISEDANRSNLCSLSEPMAAIAKGLEGQADARQGVGVEHVRGSAQCSLGPAQGVFRAFTTTGVQHTEDNCVTQGSKNIIKNEIDQFAHIDIDIDILGHEFVDLRTFTGARYRLTCFCEDPHLMPWPLHLLLQTLSWCLVPNVLEMPVESLQHGGGKHVVL